jgi:hypothetical protein
MNPESVRGCLCHRGARSLTPRPQPRSRSMSIRSLFLLLSSGILALGSVAAQQERLSSPFGEMYPVGSVHFSRDEERAIAVASAKLSGGSQKRLDGFFKVTRKGKDFWVFALLTGGRPKWGQEGFLSPALYTVVVSPHWTVSRVMQGWHR